MACPSLRGVGRPFLSCVREPLTPTPHSASPNTPQPCGGRRTDGAKGRAGGEGGRVSRGMEGRRGGRDKRPRPYKRQVSRASGSASDDTAARTNGCANTARHKGTTLRSYAMMNNFICFGRASQGLSLTVLAELFNRRLASRVIQRSFGHWSP